MDLKALLANAGVPTVKTPTPPPASTKTEKIVQAVNELALTSLVVDGTVELEVVALRCICGHPEDAHDEGGGDCEILECDCEGFIPSNAKFSPESASLAEVSEGTVVHAPSPTTQDDLDACPCGHSIQKEHLANGQCKHKDCPCSSPFVAPPAEPTEPEVEDKPQGISQLPPPGPDPMPEGYCGHLCQTCNNWWTHGAIDKCRYPDLLKQGLCQACLNGKTDQIKPEDSFVDGKLTMPAQIKIRQDERFICKAMNVEQLTNHIEFYAHRIEELRIRSLEARKMRSEIEEEELANIPEHEREAFLQALRQGAKTRKTKTPKEPKAPKEPKLNTAKAREAALTVELQGKGKSPSDAKLIASWMIKTGKSQAQVEAFLND